MIPLNQTRGAFMVESIIKIFTKACQTEAITKNRKKLLLQFSMR
jgi:hypothetical protein